MPAHITVRRRVALLCVSLIVLTLAAYTQAAPPVHKNTLSTDPVVRWIQQNAIPLRTTNPGGSDADLTPLQQIVGSASLVGLGEATHGTHEFYGIKTRLAEFLITHMGFRNFIMENDWGDSQVVDAYINGGQGNIDTVMRTSLFPSWQTREYHDLLVWMRGYNADPAHATKLHFLGMDCQGLRQSDFDAVENYFAKVDPQQATTVKLLYQPIRSALSFNRTLGASAQQQYQDAAQQVYDLLQAHQQIYTNHSSAQEFALALQNARIIVQSTTYANSSRPSLARYYQRDTFMAENVAWLHEHSVGSNPKSIVWAHDGHIANDTAYGSLSGKNMGGELRARYEGAYLPIGTSFSQGSFRAYHYPESAAQQISTPGPETYNYDLRQADLPLALLALRKIPPGPVEIWAHGPDNFPIYGLGGEDLTITGSLRQWFDVIVHVQNTTPSILLSA